MKATIKSTGQKANITYTTTDTFDSTKKEYLLTDDNNNIIWFNGWLRHHPENAITIHN